MIKLRRIPVAASSHPLRLRLGMTASRVAKPETPAKSRDDDDIKLFVLAYTAFFICFYTFLL